MSDDVVIDARYCGPSETGNGGYVCGVIAKHVGANCEITLRQPPPLDQAMHITPSDKGWHLLHDNAVIAEARAIDSLEIDLITAPSLDEATRASKDYVGCKVHPFPRCYVCGPERHEDDGLHIFAGPLGRDNAVASTWTPKPETVGAWEAACGTIVCGISRPSSFRRGR